MSIFPDDDPRSMAANDRPMGCCCKACNAVVFPARCSTGTDGVGRSDDRASRGGDRAPGCLSVDMVVVDAVVVDAVVVDAVVVDAVVVDAVVVDAVVVDAVVVDRGIDDGAGDGVPVDDSKDGDDGAG
jgi:hypothetical protein